MKKIVSILVLVFLIGCDNSLAESAKITAEESSENRDRYEMTFRSDELGIKFDYTSVNEARVEGGYEFDEGENRTVTTDDFTVTLTSPDFSPGVSEGCCYYYAGESIGTTMSDGETEVFISRSLGEIFNFKRIKIGGRDAFRFLRVNEYVEKSMEDTILIPYDHATYTNIMISGENSGPISGIENMSEYAKTFEASSEFENFLESFEFLEIEKTVEEVSTESIEVKYSDLTFAWPEAWVVEEKMDENTYRFKKGNYNAYFSILAKPEITFKSNLFLNNKEDLEISVEGAGGVGLNRSSIIYAYGVWDGDLMYFVTIANPSESYSNSYDFKKNITKSEVESFLKTFEKI